MSTPRHVSPLDRPAEDRLIALLEAVEAPLPRREIFGRVDTDFDTEEDLAKALGRLVADGRLHRAMRATRPGKPEEAVYSTKPINRVAAIAAKAWPSIDLPPQAQPKEDPVSRNNVAGKTRQRFVDFFTPERGWVSPAEVAKAIKLSKQNVKYHLTAFEEQGVVQASGNTSGRRYAIAGIPAPLAKEPAPKARKVEVEPATEKKRKAPRKPRAVREKSPAANLASFGANPLPAPSMPRSSITWAITDQGDVAINDGKNTIKLSAKDIADGVSFLERTQLVWMRKAA